MNKKQLIKLIHAIDPTATVSSMDKTQLVELYNGMNTPNDTEVLTECRHELLSNLAGMQGQTNRQAQLAWALMTADLNIQQNGKGECGVMAHATTITVTDSKGIESEVVAYNVSQSQLLTLHDEILAKGAEDDTFDYTNAKKNLNTRIRELCKQKHIPKTQIKGSKKQGYRLEVFEEPLMFEDMTNAEQTEASVKKVEEALTDKVVESVTFEQSLEVLINTYIDNGQTLDYIKVALGMALSDIQTLEQGEELANVG